MALKNLECQLAMAQLRRYLTGAALSDDALEALEQHLAECRDCQHEVAAKRQELYASSVAERPTQTVAAVAQIAEQPQAQFTQAAVSMPQTETRATKPKGKKQVSAQKSTIGMKLLQTGLNQPWIEKIPGGGRTFLLSVGLAGLLLAMSTLAQNPRGWLGETADTKSVSTNSASKAPDSLAAGSADFELTKFAGETANVEARESAPETPSTPKLKDSTVSPTASANPTVTPQQIQASSKSVAVINQQPTNSTKNVTNAEPIKANPVATPTAKPASNNVAKPATKPRVISKANTQRRTSAKPRAMARQSNARARNTARVTPRPNPSSGVKVYDENGNVINQ